MFSLNSRPWGESWENLCAPCTDRKARQRTGWEWEEEGPMWEVTERGGGWEESREKKGLGCEAGMMVHKWMKVRKRGRWRGWWEGRLYQKRTTSKPWWLGEWEESRWGEKERDMAERLLSWSHPLWSTVPCWPPPPHISNPKQPRPIGQRTHWGADSPAASQCCSKWMLMLTLAPFWLEVPAVWSVVLYPTMNPCYIV